MKYFLLAFVWTSLQLFAFDKVVIWGHKLHSHTHSYIHEGFYKGFQRHNLRVYWFDNAEDVSHFDFSNTLFITEGQVDENIPLREDAYYLIHNAMREKYQHLHQRGRVAQLAYYETQARKYKNCVEHTPYTLFNTEEKVLYMPWATDLMPEEIDAIKKRLPQIKKRNTIVYLGTIGKWGVGKNFDQIQPFFFEGSKQGFRVLTNCPWLHPMEKKHCIDHIMHAKFAPAIVGQFQLGNGYIPCRIFKNISYGAMGITNSRSVWELFQHKIVFDEDPAKLFHKARERAKNYSLEEQYELMDFVKEHHTYINRTSAILEFTKQIGFHSRDQCSPDNLPEKSSSRR